MIRLHFYGVGPDRKSFTHDFPSRPASLAIAVACRDKGALKCSPADISVEPSLVGGGGRIVIAKKEVGTFRMEEVK